MQSARREQDEDTPAAATFFTHLGAAGALGLVAGQASLFCAGLAAAALGARDSSPLLGLDPLLYFCALPLVVWVVTTGVAFSILDRVPAKR